MTDYFVLLGEPRLPWLDPDLLKSRFLQLSAGTHPDRVHTSGEAEKLEATARYAEFNAAYSILREPRDRLLHLLELELGEKPTDVQRIPPGTMDLFVEVGQTCRDVDEFLARKNAETSAVLKVKLFEQGMEWNDKLLVLQKRVDEKREQLLSELRTMNPQWKSAPAPGSSDRISHLPLERLEQIYRVLSYTVRWKEQIQERIVQIAF